MTQKKTGKEFELLVAKFHEILIQNPKFQSVKHNVFLDTPDGKRQFDVVVKNTIAEIEFTTIIECKDYTRKISIGTVDEFHSKMMDVKAAKGIIICREGFSSKAVAKAKRVNITLCTFQQALGSDWNPEIDMPVLVEEVKPIEAKINFLDKHKKETDLPMRGQPRINTIKIQDLINRKWEKGEIDFLVRQNLVKINTSEIKRPYYLNTDNGDISIEDFEVYLEVKVDYYLSMLSKVGDTMLIRDVIKKNNELLLDLESLKEYRSEFSKVQKSFKEKVVGMVVNMRVDDFGTHYMSSKIGVFKLKI